MRIDIFPADGKFPASPIDIPQVFVQAFCVWIIGASYLSSDLGASFCFCYSLSFSNERRRYPLSPIGSACRSRFQVGRLRHIHILHDTHIMRAAPTQQEVTNRGVTMAFDELNDLDLSYTPPVSSPW